MGGVRLISVRKDHVCEDGAFHKFKDPPSGADVLFEHFRPGNVRWHQIGGELDPFEAEIQNLGQSGNQESLRQTRNSDEEGVGATENGDEKLLDDLVLSDDDQFELGNASLRKLRGVLRSRPCLMSRVLSEIGLPFQPWSLR